MRHGSTLTTVGQLRRAGVFFLAITLVLVACGTYFVATELHEHADSKRESQKHISDLRRDVADWQAAIEAATVNEPVDLKKAQDKVRDTYRLLQAELEPKHEKLLVDSFGTFSNIANREIAMIQNGFRQTARKFDTQRTDPAYDVLSRALSDLDEHLDQDAETLHIESDMLLAVVLFGGVLFSLCAIRRYQNGMVGIASSLAEQNAIAASERRFQAMASHSADVITLLNREGRITFATGHAEALFAIKARDLLGRSILESCYPDDAARLFNMLNEIAEHPDAEATTEVRLLAPKGQVRHAEVFAVNLQQDQDVAGTLVTFHNLTERKAFEEQLAYQAFHDTLTGLPNRALFMDRLSHSLQMADRSNDPVTVMFIDLDNFKVINDSLGHEAGDGLLIQFAGRLQSVFRPSDTISRLGGDEFVILLSNALEPSEAIWLAKRVLGVCESFFIVGGREVFVMPSIGIAASSEGADADSLLRDADTAMYQAKANGKSSYVVFDRSMNDVAVERLELESELRSAIKKDELVLHYQPIFSIETGKITEVEALLRWQHPTRGMVPPSKFIPIAEETGLILDIGSWVLREACLQLKVWTEAFPGFANLRVSVNVSGRQLSQEGFAGKFKRILAECGVLPKQVTLEITETFMVSDLELSAKVLQELRNLGFGIAIDDFGTGYSSMSYLSKLPVDSLKIDRSFVEEMKKKEMSEGIVQAMIAMARTLGLSVVSEGIETPAQLDQLQQLGSDLGQGYYLAKPQSVASLTHLLASFEADRQAA